MEAILEPPTTIFPDPGVRKWLDLMTRSTWSFAHQRYWAEDRLDVRRGYGEIRQMERHAGDVDIHRSGRSFGKHGDRVDCEPARVPEAGILVEEGTRREG